MPGLVPSIHVPRVKPVDGRDKPGPRERARPSASTRFFGEGFIASGFDKVPARRNIEALMVGIHG